MALGLFNASAPCGSAATCSDADLSGHLHPDPAARGHLHFIPIIIAIYYAGELVWRERDRKTHEIIDATPLPNWAFAVPKTLAVALVLFSTLLISVVAAMLVQLLKGHHFELGKYLLWYVLPTGFDLILSRSWRCSSSR
jgi:hypothetical protein